MKTDIARQPLVPAFLTLVGLSAAAMWTMSDPAAPMVTTGDGGSESLLPYELLKWMQTAYPIWSHLIAGFLIVFTGLCIGRISIRFGLYPANSCLGIPLYGIITCAIYAEADYLAVLIASLLLALAIQSFGRSCRNGYSFDAFFRGSLYMGLLPLVYPPTVPLLLGIPLAAIFFSRTARELVVGIGGVLFPSLALCYISWGSRSPFTAPLAQIHELFGQGTLFGFYTQTPPTELVFLGVIAILTLISITLFLSNAYATGNKPRFILMYNIGILLLATALTVAPSANRGIVPLLAVPSALLMPILFMRINRTIATPIYLVLLALATVIIFLK